MMSPLIPKVQSRINTGNREIKNPYFLYLRRTATYLRYRDKIINLHRVEQYFGSMREPKKEHVVAAYRHLYQCGLYAIRYSKPARYTIRDRLRWAFRNGKPVDFDQRRIMNTCQFLYNASLPGSLEKKVLRTLLHTWNWDWERNPALMGTGERNKIFKDEEAAVRAAARDQFNHTTRMLNESMGMCLK